MMHKAWCSIEEVPYYFSGSSIKFQGHTGWKNRWFESNLSEITRPVAAIKSLRFALFPKEKLHILISLMFVPRDPIDNKSALVQAMACHLYGDMPLPEPMATQFTNPRVTPGLNELIQRSSSHMADMMDAAVPIHTNKLVSHPYEFHHYG